MASNHPSQPPGPETFNGKGMFVTVQVEDAADEFMRLQHGNVPIAYPMRDEPWGQRRFGVYDPSGTWVDVVQHIESAPGFWNPYLRTDVPRRARKRGKRRATYRNGRERDDVRTGADSDMRLAWYVDRVLHGGKPAEMAVGRPSRFELVST